MWSKKEVCLGGEGGGGGGGGGRTGIYDLSAHSDLIMYVKVHKSMHIQFRLLK